MPSAEILTIGTEILLGEIVDTNTRHIARALGRAGVDMFRTSSIGDNKERIAEAIRHALDRADIVITTGGLGPTVDDPTRSAVALAFGVELEFQEVLWQQVIDRFARFNSYPTDNNRRQAYVPAGAEPIENPVGTAPCFLMESEKGVVICLPGVPGEMEHLMQHEVMPYLRRRFDLDDVLVIRLLHTAGIGESKIDEMIGDLEALSNPTVGLAAHAGQVDIRITAKAKNTDEAWEIIRPVETIIRERLESWIYGVDEETLATIALDQVVRKGWRLAVVEAGLGGRLVASMPNGDSLGAVFAGGSVLPGPVDSLDAIAEAVEKARIFFEADIAVGASLMIGEKSEICLALRSPEDEKTLMVPYGGPPKLAPTRAVNFTLDLLRKI